MIVLATRSAGKLRELKPLFAAHGLQVVDLDEAGVPETAAEDDLEVFSTFEENALAKARYFHARTGHACAADDSGIVVAALGGRPGVVSKRWSNRPDLAGQALDDENNRLLLASLAGCDDRSAHYVCVAAYVDAHHEVTCRGEVHGRVTSDAKGNGGFGYDPYFFAAELSQTFGEASAAEKAGVSHRARAFGALLVQVGEVIGKTVD